MSPRAYIGKGGVPQFAFVDIDSFHILEEPPLMNEWYTVVDVAYPVRILWHTLRQEHDEAGAKTVAARWTLDGNVYYVSWDALDDTIYWIYRNYLHSLGGSQGLTYTTDEFNGAKYTCKRAHACKIEVSLRTFPGTNQELESWVTLERDSEV